MFQSETPSTCLRLEGRLGIKILHGIVLRGIAAWTRDTDMFWDYQEVACLFCP